MKIVFDHVESHERERLEEAFKGHELIFLNAPLSGTIPPDTEILSVFVDSKVTREMIESTPNLKCIATRSMGFDHIDREAAKGRVAVVAVPSYGVHTVAEFAFALLLSLVRKIEVSHARLKEGRVDHSASQGIDLFGKTLVVVGTGKIGKNMARYGKAFGMNVALCDAFPDVAFAAEIGSAYGELQSLVAHADVISLHVPLLPATAHMINESIFAKSKKGAILINTARGGVVDTAALKRALESGQIGGAGLDVFEGEAVLFGKDSTATPESDAAKALLQMPNVIMTPHIAYDTKEAKREILETSIGNITAFITGSPINKVV
jgi:D-lactate dehydrogenase